MRPINCLIVDDEPLAHRVIENFTRELSFLKIVRRCRNAMEAREALHEEDRIDLIFLDIQMPKLTGLEFMRSLQHPPLVIFTTAYADHALESYELEAVDYLKKPFSFTRFSQAVEKVQRRLAAGAAIDNPAAVEEKNGETTEGGTGLRPADPHLFVKSQGATVRVDVGEIRYLEAMGDYVKTVVKNGSLVTHQTMRQWEEQLPVPAFMRVHKSFIVAVARIDKIEAAELVVAGRRLPIGRAYRAQLMERLGLA